MSHTTGPAPGLDDILDVDARRVMNAVSLFRNFALTEVGDETLLLAVSIQMLATAVRQAGQQIADALADAKED